MNQTATTRDLLAEIGELYVRNRLLVAELERERQVRRDTEGSPIRMVSQASDEHDGKEAG